MPTALSVAFAKALIMSQVRITLPANPFVYHSHLIVYIVPWPQFLVIEIEIHSN